MAEAVDPAAMLAAAASWSLTEDAALLKLLETTAAQLTRRTASLLDGMETLGRSVERAQVRLDTTNNNLLLTADIKFIESRVREDNPEATMALKSEIDSKEETLSEAAITTEALKMGLDFVGKGYEKIDVADSESEDEEVNKQLYVLQAKNPYHIRSLPAIIGTQEWMDDDKVGLAEEEKENMTNDIIESSDTEEEPTHQLDNENESEYSLSEDEEKHIPVIEKGYKDKCDNSDFSDNDEIFKPSTDVSDGVKHAYMEGEVSEEAIVVEEDEANLRPRNFTSELSSRLGKSRDLESPTSERKSIPSDLPKMENLQKGKKKERKETKQSKQVKKTSLFDSSDEEDDNLFSPKLTEARSSPKKSLPPLPPPSKTKPGVIQLNVPVSKPPTESSQKSSSNLNEDGPSFQLLSAGGVGENDSDAGFGEKPIDKNGHDSANLFGDSSDDDFFSDLKLTDKKVDQPMKKFAFDSDNSEDDIFSGLNIKDKRVMNTIDNDDEKFVKKPIGGVSMFGEFDPKTFMSSQKDDTNSDSDDDIFSSLKVTPFNDKIQKESPAEKIPTLLVHIANSVAKDEPIQFENTLAIESETQEDHQKVETDKTTKAKEEPDSNRTASVEEISSKTKAEGFENLNRSDDDEAGLNSDEGIYSTGRCEEVLQTMEHNHKNLVNTVDAVDDIAERTGAGGINTDISDNTSKSEMLNAVTKHRPRVKNGRKPPSRAGRRNGLESSNALSFSVPNNKSDAKANHEDEIDSKLVPTSGFEPSYIDIQSIHVEEPMNVIEPKKPVGGISLFGGINPKDLLKKKNNSDGDELETARFSINSTKEEFRSDVLVENRNVDDFEYCYEPPPIANDKLQKHKSNDIFGIDATEDESDDDDLFAKAAIEKEKKPDPIADIFGDEDSDDDLFSSLTPKI